MPSPSSPRRHLPGHRVTDQVPVGSFFFRHPLDHFRKIRSEMSRPGDPRMEADGPTQIELPHRLRQADIRGESAGVRDLLSVASDEGALFDIFAPPLLNLIATTRSIVLRSSMAASPTQEQRRNGCCLFDLGEVALVHPTTLRNRSGPTITDQLRHHTKGVLPSSFAILVPPHRQTVDPA